MIFFQWILTILVVLLPLYLWAYGASCLNHQNKLLQGRFWAGIFSGGLSVGITWMLSQLSPESSGLIFFGGIIGVFFFLYFLVYIYTYFGSKASSSFLRKIAFVHLACIFSFLIAILSISYLLTGSLIFGAFLLPLFIAAFFEEMTKHLSTLGLIGQDFHFSQRELTLFAFYVVLGFVFIENILYLSHYGFDFSIWFFRSTFTFSAHLLSATICTFFWWKALAYPLISLQYFAYFFLGFFSASIVHMLYNYFTNIGNIWILLIYLVGWYFAFTQSMVEIEKSDK